MSTNLDEIATARRQSTYWAGIWAYRVMYAVVLAYVALMVGRVVPILAGTAVVCFLVLYGSAFAVGMLLFRRAGLNLTGYSAGGQEPAEGSTRGCAQNRVPPELKVVRVEPPRLRSPASAKSWRTLGLVHWSAERTGAVALPIRGGSAQPQSFAKFALPLWSALFMSCMLASADSSFATSTARSLTVFCSSELLALAASACRLLTHSLVNPFI